MSDKKPTIPALLRKIERLEAQIAAMKESERKAWAGYSSALHSLVDVQARSMQAVRLLQGEDA